MFALGWRWYRRSLNPPSEADLLLIILLALPLLGVVSYLPWPNYQSFYALPYLLTPAALMALSLTGFQHSRRATAAGLALFGMPLSFMMTSAHEHARRSTAELEVTHELMRIVSTQLTSDSVLFARSSGVQREWFGFGATLTRQALADGLTFPRVKDVPCDSAKARLDHPDNPVTIVVRHSDCGSIGSPDAVVTRRFRRFDLKTFRVVDDSSRADVFRLR
jgi:hypothetical protein